MQEQIGSGGMAKVFRAEDSVLKRPVALKLLTNRADPGIKQRFQEEAQAVASMNHPNIVSVYDVGERDGWPYIVMEYVDGTNLKHLIRQRGALPPEQAVDIVSQVASALEYAHGRGLVHCDVKPHNIIISKDGRAKLLDFGIAQAQLDRNRKTSEQVLGTPLYMAPEQGMGRAVSPATDVYGLGLVLWEALTGRAPERPDPEGPISLDFSRARLPKGLEQVVRKATATRPEDRYETVGEMMRALRSPKVTSSLAQQATVAFAPAQEAEEAGTPPAPTMKVTQPRRAPARRPPRRRSGIGLLPVIALILLVLTLGGLYAWQAISGAASDLKDRVRDDLRNPLGVVASDTTTPEVRVVQEPTKAPQKQEAAATPEPARHGKWDVQMRALRQAVTVEIVQDGKSVTKVLRPGDYYEVAADKYLRVRADPARQLYITVHRPGATDKGTLLQVAEKYRGAPIHDRAAYFYLGSPSSTEQGDQSAEGGSKGNHGKKGHGKGKQGSALLLFS